MTTLYSWGTPNGLKPLILVEELGIPYELVKVNLREGHQKRPEFVAINPNARIPALVDDGMKVFESGAILLHLAERHGRFLGADPAARMSTISWLFWQMGGVGPMFGQNFHFRTLKEQIPYAIERYSDETKRLYDVLEARLAEVPFLAGDYSIADMAAFPWMRNPGMLGVALDTLPNTQRWIETIAARPAVQRALAVTFP